MKASDVHVSVSLGKHRFCDIASHNKTEIRRLLKACQLFPVKREYLQGIDSTLPSNKNILMLKFKNKLKLRYSKLFFQTLLFTHFLSAGKQEHFLSRKKKIQILFHSNKGV